MSCTNRSFEATESLLVKADKGVPTKMSNQRRLVLELYRQESNELD